MWSDAGKPHSQVAALVSELLFGITQAALLEHVPRLCRPDSKEKDNQMDTRSIATGLTSLFVLIALGAPAVMARSKQPAPKSGGEDSIDIIGHLALPAATNQAVEPGYHWDRTYVFLAGYDHSLTVVDVTDPAHPAIAQQGSLPEALRKPRPLLLVGTVGLFAASEEMAPQAPPAKTISIIRWNGPNGARVIREFDHVTAYRQDSARSLVYVIDSNELSILRIHAAPDPRVEEEYTHHVLYDR